MSATGRMYSTGYKSQPDDFNYYKMTAVIAVAGASSFNCLNFDTVSAGHAGPAAVLLSAVAP